ncbi:hypothetical protein ACNHYB_15260 [Isoptericola jiangsuensis]|uniref:sunset domain-containing protein n=1 Tax=Isoptericola jiangsuensis TaxID=548579 RepID=UPI003AAA7C43
MRKFLAAIAIGALLSGGTVAVTATTASAAPASAAPASAVVAAKAAVPKVTITKIATRKAPYGKKATVKPHVTTSGPVSVSSKTVTVKKSGKTVAKNRKSVKLRPGTYRVTSKVKYKTSTTTTKSWSKTKTKTRTQTLVVTEGRKPSRTTPTSAGNCPSWAPIKGNQTTSHTSDWIYHVPGGRYYKVTKPEECFSTQAAARKAGYRASKNG